MIAGVRTQAGSLSPAWDSAAIRAQFPALDQEVHGHPLVYLDTAASALKPERVIDAVVAVYRNEPANVHRGVHTLSMRATEKYEGAREILRSFFNVKHAAEVIFVRGATEGLNLIASAWGRANLHQGDEVLITGLEHHSNIVPWQVVCETTGAKLKIIPIADDGDVTLSAVRSALSSKTRLVSVTHASNSLGTVLDIARIVEMAHAQGAITVVDGAQAAAHLPVDFQTLGCDFYVASGHKMYGPTGIGVMIGRKALLEKMPPYQTGGDMIRTVTFERTEYAQIPNRFEAGTPNIAGAVGLGEACRFISEVGFDQIREHEQELLRYGANVLEQLEGVRIVGTAPQKIGVLSFVVDKVHPHDLGTVADVGGVAIRTGHHCTQPVMDRFQLPATARASIGIYNTASDLDALGRSVRAAQEMFG